MYQLCTILCTGTCTLSIVSLPGILKAARLAVCVCVCVCVCVYGSTISRYLLCVLVVPGSDLIP